MSINSALNAGVSGLAAYSSALAAVSDNISNVNTPGYKRNVVDFLTLVTDTGSGSLYSAGGVISQTRNLISEEGLPIGTASDTDLKIEGDGFFVASRAPNSDPVLDPFLYTRAGRFTKDENGFLVNSGGLYLQGWPIDAAGNSPVNPSDLSVLRPVNVNSLGGTAEATTSLSFNANLSSSQTISAAALGAAPTYDPATSANNMASGNVTADFQRSVQIFDSKGGFRTVTFSFLRKDPNFSPNEWYAEVHVQPASEVKYSGAPTLTDGQVATGTVAFTPSGTFDTANTTLPLNLSFLASSATPAGGQVAWATALGVEAQTVALNFGAAGSAGGITQYDSQSNLLSTQVNGTIFGALDSVTIDKEGFVTAKFDNGILRPIYQIPLATFTNPNGLRTETGNAFSVTTESGNFTLGEAGLGANGLVKARQYEASTVDLAEEFSNLIKTQRAYSASTRIVTTADEMLAELIQIKR